jgi:endoplasmic reticulum lectin 1
MELVDDMNKDQIESIFNNEDRNERVKQFPPLSSINDDISQVKSFLEGKNCLTGGTGWWKYEFCYGKYVRQFHIDKLGSKTSILLGVFDEKLHKDFIDSHPDKRPKINVQRKQITHLYAGGSVCDKTNQQRQTEVVLKCLENAPSRSSVSLYLLEPKVCNYILGVESPLICDILDKVNEYGLVPPSSDETRTSENDEVEAIVSMDDIEIRFQND